MLKKYSNKEVSFPEVSRKVGELFKDHPKLISQFGSFLDRERQQALNKMSGARKVRSSVTLHSAWFRFSGLTFCSAALLPQAQVTATAANAPSMKPRIALMQSGGRAPGRPRKSEILMNGLNLNREENNKEQDDKPTPSSSRPSLLSSNRPTLSFNKNRSLRSGGDEEIEIHNLNLDACERVGPSYIKVPANIKPQLCSGRSASEAEVLNDTLVCTPSGAEGSFKDSAKNPHEEVLFKVEDDQLEMDMLIGKMTSLVNALKKLQELTKSGTYRYDKENPIITGSCFSLRRSGTVLPSL
jgi:histone deacetylase complex regulatory component SIN3